MEKVECGVSLVVSCLSVSLDDVSSIDLGSFSRRCARFETLEEDFGAKTSHVSGLSIVRFFLSSPHTIRVDNLHT